MPSFFSSNRESHVAPDPLVDMERETKGSLESMHAEKHLLTSCGLRQLCRTGYRVIDPANQVNDDIQRPGEATYRMKKNP